LKSFITFNEIVMVGRIVNNEVIHDAKRLLKILKPCFITDE